MLATGCTETPLESARPDPRGSYLLVGLGGRPAPTPLPAWMGLEGTKRAPGEAAYHPRTLRLVGSSSVLEFERLAP